MSSAVPLTRVITCLGRQAFGPSILPLGSVIAHWSSIIGSQLSEHVVPITLKIRRDHRDRKKREIILYLRVLGPLAVEIHHQIPQILERITTFLGKPLVTKIHLIQTSVALSHHIENKSACEVDSGIIEQIDSLTQRIDTLELRHALMALGLAIAQEDAKTHISTSNNITIK